MNDSYPGLWYIMPLALLQSATKHGNQRQAEALRRRADVRWEGTVPELQENHVDQAIFEAGTAYTLGLKWLARMNTDHKLPRLDLPGRVGGWPRACPKFETPARLKGVAKDFGYLISGRTHYEEIQSVPIVLVEVRCFAIFSEIRANYPLVDPGERGARCYMVPWAMKHIYPIEDLVRDLKLHVSRDVMPYALPTVSEMIDFAPQQRGHPDMKDWPKCHHCGLRNFPSRPCCYHCEHSL